MTVPIKEGDECLMIFGDRCIDAWWQSGDVQSQIDKRHHNLSDGFAILGTWSQPHKIENYSVNAIQLRDKIGTTKVSVKHEGIVDIRAAATVKIMGIDFMAHYHPGYDGMTGGVANEQEPEEDL